MKRLVICALLLGASGFSNAQTSAPAKNKVVVGKINKKIVTPSTVKKLDQKHPETIKKQPAIKPEEATEKKNKLAIKK